MAHYSYDRVRSIVMMNLRNKDETITAEIVTTEISLLLDALKAANLVDEIDPDILFRDISSEITVWQPDPSVLRGKKHIDWLPERKSEIKWGFWKRYEQYLEEEKGRPPSVVKKLHSITDDILNDIGNPLDGGSWDRRGMVMGEVQAGKTENYTGLICKAVDAGYKLIIVLAGMNNDLRSQTQSRLDAEFLGFESELGRLHGGTSTIGVGRLSGHGQLVVQPLTYSAQHGDFRTRSGTNWLLGGDPLLLVVKKNTSVLKRILKWVRSQGQTSPETEEKVVNNVPLLLLDDEADNASVNTKSEEDDPTAINRSIRSILKTFSQSSYVGYTATPFANIFILPDDGDSISEFGEDLFPRNFIYYITPPDNYTGAARIFGFAENLDGIVPEDHGLPLIRDANDNEIVFPFGHNKNLPVASLPDSMMEAMKAFVLVCAARRVRGQFDTHNSMLIHVTRFNLVQEQIQGLVEDELIDMQRMLEYKTGAQAETLLNELQELWEDDFVGTSDIVVERTEDDTLTPATWEEVREELLEAILKIQIKGINGLAKGVLKYDENPKGLNVIAVGGDKLSRGLTLEGLSVSYYTRPARNYDTLLQMGRWFGYRRGYLDLCRLYTTGEIEGWYQYIAVASEEMKREFRLMELSNLTPEDYGLKVRTHPNGLNITATNKIRNGRRMLATFSNNLSMTTVFAKNKNAQEQNFTHADGWIKNLATPSRRTRPSDLVWEEVAFGTIKDFLDPFQIHPFSKNADPGLIIKYIEKVNEFGELTRWTVAVISNSMTQRKHSIGGHDIGLTSREDATPTTDLYRLSNSNIISPQDQYIDLSKEERDEALANTIEAYNRGDTRHKEEPVVPSGPFIRGVRSPEKGLLLIYSLDPDDALHNETVFTDLPIIGYAISFPESERETTVEYKVNTTYWNDRYGEDEDEI